MFYKPPQSNGDGSGGDSEDSDEEYAYDAINGSNDPDSLNFDFHPFSHAPYPVDLVGLCHTELLDIFYPIDEMLDIPLDAEQIAIIRSIPRDKLLRDLRLIAGYELGQSELEIEEDGIFNESKSNVIYHINAILAEIGGPDTKVLTHMSLQQSCHWIDAYLGDSGSETIVSVLANTYEETPEILARMVVEQGYSVNSRNLMLHALENIALWNDAARERVERELVDLAELILHGHGSNLSLLNDYFMGTLSSVMNGLQLRQALPLVKEMHDSNLVDETVFGDYDEQLEELEFLPRSGFEVGDVAEQVL